MVVAQLLLHQIGHRKMLDICGSLHPGFALQLRLEFDWVWLELESSETPQQASHTPLQDLNFRSSLEKPESSGGEKSLRWNREVILIVLPLAKMRSSGSGHPKVEKTRWIHIQHQLWKGSNAVTHICNVLTKVSKTGFFGPTKDRFRV